VNKKQKYTKVIQGLWYQGATPLAPPPLSPLQAGSWVAFLQAKARGEGDPQSIYRKLSKIECSNNLSEGNIYEF